MFHSIKRRLVVVVVGILVVVVVVIVVDLLLSSSLVVCCCRRLPVAVRRFSLNCFDLARLDLQRCRGRCGLNLATTCVRATSRKKSSSNNEKQHRKKREVRGLLRRSTS